MADDLGDLAVTFRRMAATLDGEARTIALGKVGDKGVDLMDAAVVADIGDSSLSGWRHRKPIPIVSEATVERSTVSVGPQRRVRGIMRTLTSGRKAYQPGDRRVKGSYVSKRTGERTLRHRRVKGVVGATTGHGTFDTAADRIESAAPEIVAVATYEALREVVGRG